jgi:hydrogenase nickel incorporation protein HypA/HybF
MHELGIVTQVVELAAERAGAARVTRLVLAIGRDSLVLPDAIRFAFELATESTPLEGARLEIREVVGMDVKIVEMEVQDVHDLRV